MQKIKKKSKVFVTTVIIALAIIIVSALYDGTPRGVVGAEWYGLPFTWITKLIIAPQYNPWRIDFVGLTIDLVIWTIIVALIIFFAGRLQRSLNSTNVYDIPPFSK